VSEVSDAVRALYGSDADRGVYEGIALQVDDLWRRAQAHREAVMAGGGADTLSEVTRVLIDHTRLTFDGKCHCGHQGRLGESFTAHQAEALAEAGLLREAASKHVGKLPGTLYVKIEVTPHDWATRGEGWEAWNEATPEQAVQALRDAADRWAREYGLKETPAARPFAVPRVQSLTFVVSNSIDAAREWCRENGVEPYSRRTVIVTTARAFTGRIIRPRDRVVVVSSDSPWHDRDKIDALIRMAKRMGGTPVDESAPIEQEGDRG